MMAKWSVTVLVDDGSWVPIDVESETMEDAIDCVYSLDWVVNVVECLPISCAPSVGDAVELGTARFGTPRGIASGAGRGGERS